MAPEMIDWKGYDFCVASWSLRVLGTEMLKGENMFVCKYGVEATFTLPFVHTSSETSR